MTSPLRPALFLDRDNTLTVDRGYTFRRADLQWLPGAIEAIAAANAAAWPVVVVTNQSGIGRGYFGELELHDFHAAMQEALARHGAHIDGFYFCPYHQDATLEAYRVDNHPDRKPNPGMLLRAARELPIDLARSVMLGDHAHDAEAGRRAGARGYQVTPGALLPAVRAVLAGQAPPA